MSILERREDWVRAVSTSQEMVGMLRVNNRRVRGVLLVMIDDNITYIRNMIFLVDIF